MNRVGGVGRCCARCAGRRRGRRASVEVPLALVETVPHRGQQLRVSVERRLQRDEVDVEGSRLGEKVRQMSAGVAVPERVPLTVAVIVNSTFVSWARQDQSLTVAIRIH